MEPLHRLGSHAPATNILKIDPDPRHSRAPIHGSRKRFTGTPAGPADGPALPRNQPSSRHLRPAIMPERPIIESKNSRSVIPTENPERYINRRSAANVDQYMRNELVPIQTYDTSSSTECYTGVLSNNWIEVVLDIIWLNKTYILVFICRSCLNLQQTDQTFPSCDQVRWPHLKSPTHLITGGGERVSHPYQGADIHCQQRFSETEQLTIGNNDAGNIRGSKKTFDYRWWRQGFGSRTWTGRLASANGLTNSKESVSSRRTDDGKVVHRLMLPPKSAALVRFVWSSDVAMNPLTATSYPVDTDIIWGASHRASPRTGGLPSAMLIYTDPVDTLPCWKLVPRHNPLHYFQRNRSNETRASGTVYTEQQSDRPISSFIRLHAQDQKAGGTFQASYDSNTCWPSSTACGRPSMQQTYASRTGANSREFSAIGICSDENGSRAAHSLDTGSE